MADTRVEKCEIDRKEKFCFVKKDKNITKNFKSMVALKFIPASCVKQLGEVKTIVKRDFP